MRFHKLINTLINPIFFTLNNLYSELTSIAPIIFKKVPLVLKVRITTKCNLSCDFCYLKSGLNQNEKGHLSIDEWKKILNKLPKRTIIDITGAEPFASPILKDFIKLISDMGFKFSITTNGTIFNRNLIEYVLDHKISMLMFSLDGMEQTHNNLRGNENAFKRTNEFIKLVTKLKKERNINYPKITVKSTLLDENYLEVKDLIDHCHKNLNIDIFSFTLLFQNKARGGMKLYDDLDEDDLLRGNYGSYKKPQEVYNSLKSIWNDRRKWSFPIVLKPRIRFKHVKDYIFNPSNLNVKYCPQYKNNITLYYDGKFTPCDIALDLGNIRKHDYDIETALNNNRFNNFCSKITANHPSCQGCCNGMHTP